MRNEVKSTAVWINNLVEAMQLYQKKQYEANGVKEKHNFPTSITSLSSLNLYDDCSQKNHSYTCSEFKNFPFIDKLTLKEKFGKLTMTFRTRFKVEMAGGTSSSDTDSMIANSKNRLHIKTKMIYSVCANVRYCTVGREWTNDPITGRNAPFYTYNVDVPVVAYSSDNGETTKPSFVKVDGTTPLIADWDTGNRKMTVDFDDLDSNNVTINKKENGISFSQSNSPVITSADNTHFNSVDVNVYDAAIKTSSIIAKADHYLATSGIEKYRKNAGRFGSEKFNVKDQAIIANPTGCPSGRFKRLIIPQSIAFQSGFLSRVNNIPSSRKGVVNPEFVDAYTVDSQSDDSVNQNDYKKLVTDYVGDENGNFSANSGSSLIRSLEGDGSQLETSTKWYRTAKTKSVEAKGLKDGYSFASQSTTGTSDQNYPTVLGSFSYNRDQLGDEWASGDLDDMAIRFVANGTNDHNDYTKMDSLLNAKSGFVYLLICSPTEASK